MKNILILLSFLILPGMQSKAQRTIIRISTDETDLILKTTSNGRLYQAYLGEKLLHESDVQFLPHNFFLSFAGNAPGWEVYSGAGAEDCFEQALAVRHNDGNPSSVLYYRSHETKRIDDNVEETIIQLADNAYPVEVKLHTCVLPGKISSNRGRKSVTAKRNR
jgi:alpha-galactosidase